MHDIIAAFGTAVAVLVGSLVVSLLLKVGPILITKAERALTSTLEIEKTHETN